MPDVEPDDDTSIFAVDESGNQRIVHIRLQSEDGQIIDDWTEENFTASSSFSDVKESIAQTLKETRSLNIEKLEAAVPDKHTADTQHLMFQDVILAQQLKDYARHIYIKVLVKDTRKLNDLVIKDEPDFAHLIHLKQKEVAERLLASVRRIYNDKLREFKRLRMLILV